MYNSHSQYNVMCIDLEFDRLVVSPLGDQGDGIKPLDGRRHPFRAVECAAHAEEDHDIVTYKIWRRGKR